MKLPVDLLIFDLDGTLTDSIPPAIEALQEMLAELRLPHRTAAEINEHVGFGEYPLITGTIGSTDPALVKKACEAYERIYIEKGLKKVPLYPNVKKVLEAFRKKKKVIVSNKKDIFIKIILENHGLSGCFDEIAGGDTSPCLKPDPCTVLKIINKLKIKKEKVLYVGDMTIDVETAHNAGIKICAVTYGFNTSEQLKKSGADMMINDILELKDLII